MAHPIKSGRRTNFVLWLYGDHGRIPGPGSQAATISAHERWQVPSVVSDGYAPF